MENYEQKYKEALKVMESLYNVVKYQLSSDALLTRQTIEKAFPELCESEDERIRKELIEFVKSRGGFKHEYIAWLEKQKTTEEALQYLKENHSPSEMSDFQAAMNISVAKAYNKGYTDGLEKQGKKSEYDPYKVTVESIADMCKTDVSSIDLVDFYGNVKVKCKEAIDYDKTWTEKQGEQKPTGKVEPKFKIGDTIVEKDLGECGCGTIVNIKDGKYIFDDGCFIWIKGQERWQLVGQKPTWDEKIKGLTELETYILSLVPDRPLDAIKVDTKNIRYIINKEQNPAWSEEDEFIRTELIKYLEGKWGTIGGKINGKERFIGWLKSLKPNHWKPSEEQMEIIDMILTNESMDDNVARIMRELKEQLEKL